MTPAAWFLVVVTVLVLVLVSMFDAWALWTEHDTISWALLMASRSAPWLPLVLAFLAGLLAAHFFWPQTVYEVPK